jgi:hypothetical protein
MLSAISQIEDGIPYLKNIINTLKIRERERERERRERKWVVVRDTTCGVGCKKLYLQF